MNRKTEHAIRAVWCLGFAVGTVVHLSDILIYGLWPYTYAPTWMNVFWTSLAVLDPLVVMLLIRRLRTGLVAGTLVMIADLAVNTYAGTLPGITGWSLTFALQLGFGAFVFATVWPLWKRA